MKILIVEDEPKTGDYLRQGLREAGFTVDLVANGLDGLHLGAEVSYDLVILDACCLGWTAGRCSRRGAPTGDTCRCCC